MSKSRLADNIVGRVNLGDSLTRTAARYPNNTAMLVGGRRYSYREFNAWVNQVGHGLINRGYRRGDALAMASGNSAEFLVTYYACAKIGVVFVPINLGWKTREVVHVLNHSGARGLVVETQLVDPMAPAVCEAPSIRDVILAPGTAAAEPAISRRTTLPVESVITTYDELSADNVDEPLVVVEDRDPVSYLYTSGTTSAPKGVVGSHVSIYLESISLALEARFDQTDVFVAMMPMFHAAQLNVHCTPAIMVGSAVIVHRGFDADRLLATIPKDGVTQLFGLPMMYRELLEHPAINSTDLSTLRRALYAMAPMPEELLRRCIKVFDCDFYLLFGQTEMSPCSTIFRPEHQLTHNGAVGTPVVNVHAAIMNDSGELQPQGKSGEIVYRGPHVMTEFLKDPDATETAFAHGWFHSGDIGHFDEDGLLWFEDRKKDIIKTGGENVASIEVEKAIYAVDPAVREVVVVGLPHDQWSEAITAVVVLSEGATIDPESLIAKVKNKISPYKAPKSVIVVDELPRTSTGKVQKNAVRQAYRDHYSQHPPLSR